MFTKHLHTIPGKLIGISLLFALVLLIIPGHASAQNVPDEVVKAFSKGRAKSLSAHLHTRVELTILTEKNTVSKHQAIRILQDFFDDHPPKQFEVTYEGSKTESRYSLCNYHSGTEKYRVNLYFMDDSGKRIIYYLTIEKT